MFANISLPLRFFAKVEERLAHLPVINIILFLSVFLSVSSIVYAFLTSSIVAYGDAESHLNIAKRVIHSLTPGFAQLGGIWLPLPHLLMVPFVANDFLWRTGLAGSIVSGISFVITCVYLYKFCFMVLKNRAASFMSFLVFALNPNVLYMQTTPMTELPLLAFFMLAIYYFTRFLRDNKDVGALIVSAFFALCASLSRYDGWLLVLSMASLIVLSNIPKDIFKRYFNGFSKAASEEGIIFSNANSHEELSLIAEYRKVWSRIQGKFVLFSSFAFIGIALWLLWDFLILGDPFYFTNSQFSAKSQQNAWNAKGQLPAYNDLLSSFSYYFVTAMSNVGILLFIASLIGLYLYIRNNHERQRLSITLLLFIPFVFYVLTLYIGQSVIFIPHLTPTSFEWTIFNVRYGLMMVPTAAFFFAYLYKISGSLSKIILVGLLGLQVLLFVSGFSKVYTYVDGTTGLSSAKTPDAEYFMKKEYDHGLVLIDDFARTLSIVRSGIPMQNVIYVGTKPYWEESLQEPEKYARWVIMQRDDSVWNSLMKDDTASGHLYKYYQKVYTSPEILVFKRNSEKYVATAQAQELEKKPEVKTPSEEILVEAETVARNSTYWKFQAVDTMKLSRDGARNPDTIEQIPQTIRQAASLQATHVAIGTPYDEEFYPVIRLWVEEARKYNLKIWFRGNASGWEGWFDYPKLRSIDEHHIKIAQFIKNNETLFEEGDIFTPVPEPENGLITDPRGSDEKKVIFNEFLVKSYQNCIDTMTLINKKASCGYFSVNGDIAREVLTEDTVKRTGGRVVIDHYVKDATRFGKDIEFLHNKLQAKVVIGEFGGPIPDIHGDLTQEEQAFLIREFLSELVKRKAYVEGMNYWVTQGGTTRLFDEEGTPRLAAITLRDFYNPTVVQGVIQDDRKQPIENVEIVFSDYNLLAKTDKNGRYEVKIPAGNTNIVVKKDNYLTQSKKIEVDSLSILEYNTVLSPVRTNFKYKFDSFLERVRIRIEQLNDSIEL